MTTTRYLWNPINQNIIREYDGAGNTVASYTTERNLYGNCLSTKSLSWAETPSGAISICPRRALSVAS